LLGESAPYLQSGASVFLSAFGLEPVAQIARTGTSIGDRRQQIGPYLLNLLRLRRIRINAVD